LLQGLKTNTLTIALKGIHLRVWMMA